VARKIFVIKKLPIIYAKYKTQIFMKKVESLMDNLSDFIKAIDAKNSYDEFIEEDGKEINAIVNNLHNCFRDSFYEGWKKGKENGKRNARVNLHLEIAINLIKHSELDDDTILKILGKENERHWIGFLKETREELKK
jgi:hypothetical protein